MRFQWKRSPNLDRSGAPCRAGSWSGKRSGSCNSANSLNYLVSRRQFHFSRDLRFHYRRVYASGPSHGNHKDNRNRKNTWCAKHNIVLVRSFCLHHTDTGLKQGSGGSSTPLVMNEKVSFLSGIRTRRIIILIFVMSGICNAITGIMLSGYSNQAFQAMGDPYLIPAIAAVVIGGTSISGGSGSYLGTIIGVIFITYLSSLLSVLQVPEAGRQIFFGVIIIAMTISYSRRKEER